MAKLEGTKKTSITVSDELWRRFGAKLSLASTDFSVAIDRLVREYVDGEKALPVGPQHPDSLSYEERLILDWWNLDPEDPLEAAFRKQILRKMKDLPQNVSTSTSKSARVV